MLPLIGLDGGWQNTLPLSYQMSSPRSDLDRTTDGHMDSR